MHERPEPRAVELLLAKLADLRVPTPPAPEPLSPADAAQVAAEASERVDEYARQSGRGRDAFPAMVLQALKRARYDPRNLGTPGSRAPRTAISPRPFAATRIWSVTGRCCGSSASRTSRCPTICPSLRRRPRCASGRLGSFEYQADEICLAWLLERRLFELGWEEAFKGEVTGLIPAGLFVRFADVFEGFVPARRLPGDYFELNTLGTALVGRRGGRTHRLGDRLRVRAWSTSAATRARSNSHQPAAATARAIDPQPRGFPTLGGDCCPPATHGERNCQTRTRVKRRCAETVKT